MLIYADLHYSFGNLNKSKQGAHKNASKEDSSSESYTRYGCPVLRYLSGIPATMSLQLCNFAHISRHKPESARECGGEPWLHSVLLHEPHYCKR